MSDSSVSGSSSSHESHETHESHESHEEHEAHDSADRADEHRDHAEHSADEAEERSHAGDAAGAQAAAHDAQREADEARREANEAQQAADAARQRADETGSPPDQVSATHAQQYADEARIAAEEAQQAADRARAAANSATPAVAAYNGESTFTAGGGGGGGQAHALEAPAATGALPGGPLAPGEQVVVSSAEGLNLRSGPGASFANQGTLPAGTGLTITEPPAGQAARPGWVPVATEDGRQGWVSERWVSRVGQGQAPGQAEAPAQAQAQTPAAEQAGPVALPPNPDGTPQSFVSANYTDLGRPNADGPTWMSSDLVLDPNDPAHPENAEKIRAAEEALRASVVQDLDRLDQAGVTNVRVWADNFPENNLGTDCTDPNVARALTRRVQIIAEEAQKRGMTVTVDLFDGHTQGRDAEGVKDVAMLRSTNPGDAQMTARIETIVKGNAQADNVMWSVGNEIGDYRDPIGPPGDPYQPHTFAGWYKEKTDQIRAAVDAGGGNVNRPLIQLEVTPGALGHPGEPGSFPDAERAMAEVVKLSDVVSVHFYPPVPPGELENRDLWKWDTQQKGVTGNDQGIYPVKDHDSLKTWARLSAEAGKPFTLGEFGVPRDTQGTANLTPQQYVDTTAQWLQKLQGDGIDVKQVSFWQFAKDEWGHLDPGAVDIKEHRGHTQALGEWLVGQGLLKKLPWD